METHTITTLQKLAFDKSPEGRAKLVDQVVHFYLEEGKRPGLLTKLEKDILFDIVMRLVSNAKDDIRKVLSENLAHEMNVPKELIVTLANDEILIAHPVLTHSRLLGDTDLISIIANRGPLHQFSIAGREQISEQVSDALINAGDPQTMERLFNNVGAEISQEGLEKGIQYSQVIKALQEPLLRRPEMKADFAAKIYWFASEALKADIVKQYDISDETLQNALDKTFNTLTQKTRSVLKITEDQKVIAQKLYNSGSLSMAVLISILRRGQYALFRYLLALLTKLSEDQIVYLVERGDIKNFITVCKAIGVSENDFVAVFLLTRVYVGDGKPAEQDDIQKMGEIYKSTDISHARASLKQWREDPNSLQEFGMSAA